MIMNQNSVRVSDIIVDQLIKQGAKSTFMLSGGGMMHLMDALYLRPELKVICQHHEQCSSYSADAYSRVSENFGVCFATSGPGASNTVTGIIGAWQDSVPCMFITGQSKREQTIRYRKQFGLRQFGTFEVDILENVKSVTKYSVFLDDPKMVLYHMQRAFYEMRNRRPGPVLIDVPIDVQGAKVDPATLVQFTPPETNNNLSQILKEFSEVAVKIQNAKRPLIVFGFGARQSLVADQLIKMCETKGVPFVVTPQAADIVAYDHPLCMGRVGLKADRHGNIAVQNADVLVFVGCSLHVMTTGYELDRFAPKVQKVLIDPDQMVLDREEVGVQQKICATVQDFNSYMNEKLNPLSTIQDWIKHCHKAKKELDVEAEHAKYPRTDLQKMNCYDIFFALNKLTKEDDVLVVDAGLPFYLIGQGYKVKKGQRIIVPGSLGQMGYALPASTGASLACGGRRSDNVICIVGDGSVQTNIHEFSVHQHNNLNIKTIVINNNGYVSIRNTQRNYFEGRYLGTDQASGVGFPNFEKLIEAYKLNYTKVVELNQLLPKLQEFLNKKGPAVMEVYVSPEQEVLPSVQSMKKADGTMVSKPIHDMYPYLNAETLKSYLVEGVE